MEPHCCSLKWVSFLEAGEENRKFEAEAAHQKSLGEHLTLVVGAHQKSQGAMSSWGEMAHQK